MTKLSNLTKVTTAGDDTLFYLVDPARPAGDRSVGMDKDDVATFIGGGSATLTSDINQTAHGLVVGDAIKNNGTIFVKAQADDVANSDVLGVVSNVTDVDNFTYQFGGILVSGAWTLGVDYFLSVATAGSIVTEPTYADGDVRQYIGTGVEGGLLLNVDLGQEIVPPITEDDIKGTAVEDLFFEGAIDYSLISPAHGVYQIQNANASVTFIDLPDTGFSVCRTFRCLSSFARTLTFTNVDYVYGEYATDGTMNLITIIASTTALGTEIHISFDQPNP